MRSFRTLLPLAALLAVVGGRASAQVVLMQPDSSTAPFEAWSRGDQHSTYAHWDLFASATAANPPDAGQMGLTGASLIESSGGTSGAFISGSGNIYSFTGVVSFDVTVPAYGLGLPYQTTLVAQIVTLGTQADSDSIALSYDGLAQPVGPDSIVELGRTALGGFGGDLVSTLYEWNVNGSPSEFLLQFAAAESSMSLDQLVIDTFVQPMPAAMPGDFDGNNVVDAADYALWRSQFGTPGPQADGNGDGRVDAADYTIWREPGSRAIGICLAVATTFIIGCDRYVRKSAANMQKGLS
jgi:hypothetical protein